MLVPSIFGESLFDDWFDFPQWPDFRDIDKAEKKLFRQLGIEGHELVAGIVKKLMLATAKIYGFSLVILTQKNYNRNINMETF